MRDYDKIEKKFIEEQLWKHAEYLEELYSDSITTKGLIKSGVLSAEFISSSNFKVKDETLSVKFPDYGRFIEIAFHKKKKILSQKNVRNPFKKRKKKKNTNWYTRNSFGAQNRLIGRLMYGLSDIERERIINLFEQKK